MADDAPILTNRDVAELTEFRRTLHRHPEVSGEEAETAARVSAMLEATAPDRILTGLGGHGLAAIYEGAADGPSVLLRCELDALPIEELNPDLPYRSTVPGKGHLCGHDGHMAILLAVARWLHRNPPAMGRVVLLFQPAEEDGSGAAKVIEDPRFEEIRPDIALSLHNYPGVPDGEALLAQGIANCASRGMKILLKGRTAHASEPENGISPAPALARLIPALTALSRGADVDDPDFALATVTHARLGEPAFGIAPGEAELRVTLRSRTDAQMQALVEAAEDLIAAAAVEGGLAHEVSYHDIFRHCENAPEATRILNEALVAGGITVRRDGVPMRASEDFGRFGDHASAAMVFLGSGVDTPRLHNPDFDFPDSLIPIGAGVFVRALRGCLG